MDVYVDKFDALWHDYDGPSGSAKVGSMDRVPRKYTKDLMDSLRLLKVDGLHIKLHPAGTRSEYQRNPQIYAHFNKPDVLGFAREKYAMHCTDVMMEQQYCRDGPKEEWDLPGPLYLCISLASIYRGYAYKLVAGVIPRV